MQDYSDTMLEPIMYWTSTTIAHIPRVALVPKLLKKIAIMGWSAS